MVEYPEQSFQEFLQSWGWKREGLNDVLLYHKDYKYPFDLDNQEVVASSTSEKELIIHQSKAIALTVWDSAIVMSKFFEIHPEYFKGKKVLELGCGCGLIGMVLAALGAERVVLTDLEEYVSFIRSNVADNNLTNNCQVETLCWGKENTAQLIKKANIKGFDLIVGADILYLRDQVENLASTITTLREANPDAKVLFSHGRNCFARDDFLQFIREPAVWVQWAKFHPVYRTSDVYAFGLYVNKDEFGPPYVAPSVSESESDPENTPQQGNKNKKKNTRKNKKKKKKTNSKEPAEGASESLELIGPFSARGKAKKQLPSPQFTIIHPVITRAIRLNKLQLRNNHE